MKKSVFCVLCGFAVLAGCGDDSSKKSVTSVPGTCDAGLVKCSDDLLGTVDCGLNGQWKTDVVPCPAATPVCDVTKGKCVAVSAYNCVPKSTKCADDSHYTVCNDDGRWGSTYTCSSDLPKCNSVLNKCVEVNAPEPECAPASTECVNNELRTCNSDGKWGSFVSCSAAKPVCDADGKLCVALPVDCTPDDTECVNDEIRTCDGDGKWGSFVSCPDATPVCDADGKLCVAKDPTYECKPQATECDDGEFRTCNDSGQWNGWVGCPVTAPVCDADGKKCVAKDPLTVCSPLATECKNNRTRMCDKTGQWGGWVACSASTPVCDDDGKKCVALPPSPVCTPDDTECANDEIRTCDSDGFWGDFVACPSDTPLCSKNGKTCVPTPVCTPGVDYCAGGSSKSAGMYHCDEDGQRGELIEHCSSGSCNPEGTACMVCAPGTKKCTSDHDGEITCTSDGEWDTENPEKCDAGFVCDDDLLRCACTPGEELCLYVGKRTEGMYRCNSDGDIDHSEDLIKHCVCNETFDACLDECEVEGARKCDNIDILVCKDKQWQKDSHTCGDSQICNDSIGSVCISALDITCKPGESICKDGVLMECENGLFREVEKPECEDGAPCEFYCLTTSLKSGNRQAEYADKCVDASYCIGDVQYTCDRRGRITSTPCSNKSQECVMGETSLGGLTQITAKCQFVKCSENSYSCAGDVLSVCSDGRAVKLVDCSVFGLVCDKGSGCIFK